MTEHNNPKELILTVVIFMSAIAGLSIAAASKPDTVPSVPPAPRFRTVDSYHGCDIVRYQDDTNRWHYFLDCTPKD
jgi:hypothetical protein